MVKSILEKLRETGYCTDEELQELILYVNKGLDISQRTLDDGRELEVVCYRDAFDCDITIDGVLREHVPYLMFLLWDFHKEGSFTGKDYTVGCPKIDEFNVGVVVRYNRVACEVYTKNNVLCRNWKKDSLRYGTLRCTVYSKFTPEHYGVLDMPQAMKCKLAVQDYTFVSKKNDEAVYNILNFTEDLLNFEITRGGRSKWVTLQEARYLLQVGQDFEPMSIFVEEDDSLKDVVSVSLKQNKDVDEHCDLDIELEEEQVEEVSDDEFLEDDIVVVQMEYDRSKEDLAFYNSLRLGEFYTTKTGEKVILTGKFGEYGINCIVIGKGRRSMSASELERGDD